MITEAGKSCQEKSELIRQRIKLGLITKKAHPPGKFPGGRALQFGQICYLFLPKNLFTPNPIQSNRDMISSLK